MPHTVFGDTDENIVQLLPLLQQLGDNRGIHLQSYFTGNFLDFDLKGIRFMSGITVSIVLHEFEVLDWTVRIAGAQRKFFDVPLLYKLTIGLTGNLSLIHNKGVSLTTRRTDTFQLWFHKNCFLSTLSRNWLSGSWDFFSCAISNLCLGRGLGSVSI